MLSRINRIFSRNQIGATGVEYALLLAIVSLAIVAIGPTLYQAVLNLFNQVIAAL